MIPQIKKIAVMPRIKRVAPRKFPARGHERPEITPGQPQAAKLVEQQAHAHAAPRRRHEKLQEFRAHRVVAPEKRFDVDRAFCRRQRLA